ncbi:PREDICTED: uncharacterized protein LOC109343765 isoform X2 [Lupinus angustifolius]|uniref:uncharacterized protein LOC109343765 isoform X2 n=1 Tax=Lupinus angustifolius TaxID=3871 RepID=UPI00092F0AB1|nr:PREDICTED: uncharacterized protein LOC109343765 isoform X2 [Lupinus angustifolius]
MMTIFNDDWVSAALTDDTLVADLLLTIKNTVSVKSHAMLPFTWGLKKPRANSASRSRLPHADASRCGGGGAGGSTRFSPTTPLSWSGAASPSDTGDGNDDSNHRHVARSKVTSTSGFTVNSASTKKCRKKKTFAELKEEESSLLKEKEIANKNANFEVEKAKNERMKRMKIDFGTKWHSNPSSTSVELQCTPTGQPHQRIIAPLGPLKVTHTTQDDSHSQVSESRGHFSLIPDLNMMPPDDDS